MVGGENTLSGTAPSFVQYLATYACVYLEKDQMVVKTMLVLEHENGFLTMVVQLTFLLGEKLGFPYLVFVTGLQITQCLLNFGFFLHFFQCIQVC